MLVAAGMGIGLVFWGAAEPLTFFTSLEPGVEDSNGDLAHAAMSRVFLHWGFHAWATYGLSASRSPTPSTVRVGRSPSDGHWSPYWARSGSARGWETPLQPAARRSDRRDHVNGHRLRGQWLDKGIKYLSNANLIMAGIFLLAVLMLGETFFILCEFVQNLGGYFGDLVSLSFDTSAFSGKEGQVWQSSWTTFYWGWWMSWAPFVGVFIARISRGRTVREFIAGVLLVPTFVTFL